MLSTIQKQIIAFKKQKDMIILAHSYQAPEILEIADEVGDSFALCNAAKKYSQQNVILCGVKFMAETIKIMSPEKNVIMPNEVATCPMAEQITPAEILSFRQKNPIFKVVSYINTTAELKALSDVCVTSSSAIKILEKITAPVLFVPDKNLGAYIKSKMPGKDIILMSGCCPIHDSVTEEDVIDAKRMYPEARFAMHPEMSASALNYADFVGSTSEIMEYAAGTTGDIVIGTEKSISDQLSIKFPNRRFPLLSKKLMCNDMRITTLVDVYKAVIGTGGASITVDEEIRLKAKNAIDAMLELGK